METRHLRYFIAVAEAGSFTAAASRLYVAQPALSVQLRQLEDLVGQPLFLRHRRGVVLTPAGRVLLEDARAVMSQMDRALVRARAQGEQPTALRIGLVPSASQTVLQPLMRALREVRPNLAVEVREMATQAQVDGLKEGRLDYCIGRPPRGDRGVRLVLQQDDQYCLALPADHPLVDQPKVTIADLAHESVVSFGRDRGVNYFDRVVAMCMEAGFSPAISHEVNTFSSALGIVAAGLGVSIVPASCVLLAHPGIVLRRLPPSHHRSVLALMAPNDRRHPFHEVVERIGSQCWQQMRLDVEKALR